MTAYGSEQIAVAALRAGAASYVPKTNLRAELREALRAVLRAVEAKHGRERVREFLQSSHSEFVLGCEEAGSAALVSFLQDGLEQLSFCDAAGLFQVTTALVEALANAVDHGSLELDSALRETDDYEYGKLRVKRMKESPYCDRRVFVSVHLTPTEATYVVRDEGSGFDPSILPDPTDPDNLLKASGRGIMLIRTFMDDVSFNDVGNQITMIKRAEPVGEAPH
jgi:anti-sigma regulatory factor (Ser/Thr protein kinase)